MESLFNFSAKAGTTFPVSGTVSNASSATLSGATVYANSSSASLSTTTSASGNFSFSLLNGTYQLTALASGYTPERKNVTVAGAALSGVDFSLASVSVTPTSFPVNGSVLSFANSDPIANATVFANGSSVHLVATTPANGGYAFVLANGSYALTVTAPRFQPTSSSLTVSGAPVEGFDFELVPVGMVTYPADGVVSNGSDGAPIANAKIYFTDGAMTLTAVTNASGGFQVNLPNGTYDVTVVAHGYVSDLSNLSISGPSTGDLNFTLSPVTGSHGNSGGGSFPFLLPLYLGEIAAAFAAIGLAGWGLGRWSRRTSSRGAGSRRRK